MTLVTALKELWNRRILVAVAALVAAAVGLLIAFQVSLLPPSASERSEASAAGSISILVDSARSPLADTRRDVTGLSARAGVLARVMAGGNVVRLIAREAGVPVNQIAVSGPVPLPGEAAGAGEAAGQLPYGISFGQSGELPVVGVETRAPSAPAALALAAAAPDAIRRVVRAVQLQQRTPPAKRVQLRVLGPAQASVVEESSGKRLALLVFLVVFALGLLAILGWPRLVTAWRDSEVKPRPADVPQQPTKAAPQPAQTVVHIASGRPGDSEAEATEEKVGQRGESG